MGQTNHELGFEPRRLAFTVVVPQKKFRDFSHNLQVSTKLRRERFELPDHVNPTFSSNSRFVPSVGKSCSHSNRED